MKYNILSEGESMARAMKGTETGRLAPVEEDEWEKAVHSFVDHYSWDTLPAPDSMRNPPRTLPLEGIRDNLREMCKFAERTHRFRRFLLRNREVKRWAIWLDIGCRSGFRWPEYPKKYQKAVKDNKQKGAW